eukprot:7290388-Alexandrium_andersonii.AAC.1
MAWEDALHPEPCSVPSLYHQPWRTSVQSTIKAARTLERANREKKAGHATPHCLPGPYGAHAFDALT